MTQCAAGEQEAEVPAEGMAAGREDVVAAAVEAKAEVCLVGTVALAKAVGEVMVTLELEALVEAILAVPVAVVEAAVMAGIVAAATAGADMKVEVVGTVVHVLVVEVENLEGGAMAKDVRGMAAAVTWAEVMEARMEEAVKESMAAQ